MQTLRVKNRSDKNVTAETVMKDYLTSDKVKFPSLHGEKIQGNENVQAI